MLKFNKTKIVMAFSLSVGLSVGSIFAPITSPEKVSAVAVPEYRTDLLSDLSLSENNISGIANTTGSVVAEVSYNGVITQVYTVSIDDFNRFSVSFEEPTRLGSLIKVRVSGENGTQEETLTFGPPSKVKVYYQDEDGNDLQPSTEMNGYVGESYATASPTRVNGYTIYKKPTNQNGIYTSETQSVVYVYKKLATPYIVFKPLELYVGDTWNPEDYFIEGADFFGMSIPLTSFTLKSDVDTSKPGQYDFSYGLTLQIDEDVRTYISTRIVTVLENKQSINGSDYTITVGDAAPEASEFQATANGKDGNPIGITVNLSQADLSTAGAYDVLLTSADGQTKTVKLTVNDKAVPENKQTIDGSDLTMTIGDKTPETSDFQATATDKDGNPVEVTVDLSQADLNTVGTYDVLLTSSDGQTKTVKLTVKEKSNIVDDNNNKDEVVTPINPTPISSAKGTKVTPTKTSPTSDSVIRNSYSDKSLPTTGEKDSTSAIVAGILLIVIALLTFGFLKKKKK